MLLVSLLIISFIYAASATRLDTLTHILGIQGFLLAALAILELHELSPINLGLIIIETVIFKGLVVPYSFRSLIRKLGVRHEVQPNISNFACLALVLFATLVSFYLAYRLHNEHLQVIYLAGALLAFFTGLMLILFRKNIVTHVAGYLILENGIFLFSLSLGSEMPLVVNAAILLDLATSLTMLTLFASRIGETLRTLDARHLNNLDLDDSEALAS